ncbi:IS66-like element accessory protein TnpA [Paraburkholderia sp. Clong3]|uniref:IS66-like element accessory protein TnpA n=1 Tax=Paraburkholderia sp. Clong3 TaxID=2991061 RepID=UPI003D1E9383
MQSERPKWLPPFRVAGTILGSEEKPASGTRKGSPNHSPEFRRRLAAAACEPGVSVSKLAREHGINANMLFKWRRRYRAEQAAGTTGLVPVMVVSDAPVAITPTSSVEQEMVKPTRTIGTIEVRIGRAVVKVDGVVDAETLRTVLKSVRS